LRKLRAVLGGIALLFVAGLASHGDDGIAAPFSFTSLDGATFESWRLLGTPLVINVGSHF